MGNFRYEVRKKRNGTTMIFAIFFCKTDHRSVARRADMKCCAEASYFWEKRAGAQPLMNKVSGVQMRKDDAKMEESLSMMIASYRRKNRCYLVGEPDGAGGNFISGERTGDMHLCG